MGNGGLPRRIQGQCRYPWCRKRATTRHGYCPEHEVIVARKYRPAHTPRERFYSTKAWLKLRQEVLTYHPMCAGRYCHKPAQMVDHIKQIKQPDGSVDMQLALDINNLQPLCNRCHAVKRGVERAASRKYKQRELLAEHDDYQETYYAE